MKMLTYARSPHQDRTVSPADPAMWELCAGSLGHWVNARTGAMQT